MEKKKETSQFLDGLLLGGLLTGLVTALFVAVFVFQRADNAGEGPVYVQERVTIRPVNDHTVHTNEQSQSLMIDNTAYTIQFSFTDNQVGLTYRSLENSENEVFASIWSKEGQQLLYRANKSLLAVSGEDMISVIGINSENELTLQTTTGSLLIYNLEEGMVMPQSL